jgi:hypothetical protein
VTKAHEPAQHVVTSSRHGTCFRSEVTAKLQLTWKTDPGGQPPTTRQLSQRVDHPCVAACGDGESPRALPTELDPSADADWKQLLGLRRVERWSVVAKTVNRRQCRRWPSLPVSRRISNTYRGSRGRRLARPSAADTHISIDRNLGTVGRIMQCRPQAAQLAAHPTRPFRSP